MPAPPPPPPPPTPDSDSLPPDAAFATALARAIARRAPLIKARKTEAFRVFGGLSDGLDGIMLDVYGDGAVLIVYEGRAPRSLDHGAAAHAALDALGPLGVRAVYLKPFAKDRSRIGDELPPIVTDPTPAAGKPLQESQLIREHEWTLEVRLFDGLSTGLFLDQRENRRWVCEWVRARSRGGGGPPHVLNTFAYTCAFSVAAAVAGATTASVDVSGRYLDWGKRNFAHNRLDPAAHRFARMDTFEFFGYAQRKDLRYDLIILDPPSFASGSKKKGIRPWSSVADYARLVREAAPLLAPGGAIFASTNTTELCQRGRLDREIVGALGREPEWLGLPEPPVDFGNDRGHFAARAFRPNRSRRTS